MGTMLLPDTRRPTGPVPADPDHEFMATWVLRDDEELARWHQWFTLTRVRHVIKTHAMTLNGVTGTYAMLYTHRLLIPARGGQSRWCCIEEA